MCRQIFSAFLLASFLRTAYGEPTVQVPHQHVTYRGSVVGDIEHFQGISFGKDTSGERRFTPPEPYVPEAGTEIDATRAGALCPQTKDPFPLLFDETPEFSEDCLNLRIARTVGATSDSKLPVVVWIHGGGVVKGSAYDSHFNPDKVLQLAAEDGTPVIYAAIHYRMTIFGFPRLPLLKDQKSLNLGLRDQRLALQWIQDNIEAFGGDPSRVTVYGLSAGGTFSSMHTLSFGGEKGVPFQQAWMMSGPAGTALKMDSDEGTMHTKNVAERVDCASSTKNDAELIECLRKVPMTDLLDVAIAYSRENHPPAGTFTFIPSVDGDFFPDRQSVLIRAGRFVKGINQVYGWTQEDGAMNAGDPLSIHHEDDIRRTIQGLANELSDEQFSNLFAAYPVSAFGQEHQNYKARKKSSDPAVSIQFFRLSRMLRDLLFTCPSIDFGYEMFRQTRKTQPDFNNVRLYSLNQSAFTPMLAAAGMPFISVMHGSDTPYIFNGFPEGDFKESDRKLAESFTRGLVQFAYSGSPVSNIASREQFFDWPSAYHLTAMEGLDSGLPDFNIEVIGGPYGTGPSLVKSQSEESTESTYGFNMQAVLDGVLEFAGMGTAGEVTRESLVGSEDLHKRCAYWRSLDDSLGR